jgi:hypothetical protein
MTMKFKFFVFLISTALLNACAHRPTVHTIKSECRTEMAAARTAVQLRDQGKSKQDVLATLPPLYPDSTRLLRTMYHIVDEVYVSPHLNALVYGIYRFEYCAHQLQDQTVPQHFDAIAPKLFVCQTQFAGDDSKALVACVRGVFPQTHNTQPVSDTGND